MTRGVAQENGASIAGQSPALIVVRHRRFFGPPLRGDKPCGADGPVRHAAVKWTSGEQRCRLHVRVQYEEPVAMKRFITIFAINYVVMASLCTFMILFVPEVFQGDPPLKGADRVLDWIGDRVSWFLVVYTFPAVLIGDRFRSFLSIFLFLLIPSTLWTCIFIYGHRVYRQLRTRDHVVAGF